MRDFLTAQPAFLRHSTVAHTRPLPMTYTRFFSAAPRALRGALARWLMLPLLLCAPLLAVGRR